MNVRIPIVSVLILVLASCAEEVDTESFVDRNHVDLEATYERALAEKWGLTTTAREREIGVTEIFTKRCKDDQVILLLVTDVWGTAADTMYHGVARRLDVRDGELTVDPYGPANLDDYPQVSRKLTHGWYEFSWMDI